MAPETDIKKVIMGAFREAGFSKAGSALRYGNDHVSILVSTEKSRWGGGDVYINVGFWLFSLGELVPSRVELTHMSYRLEDLFQQDREMILTATSPKEKDQPVFLKLLREKIRNEYVPDLVQLTQDLSSMKQAFSTGRFRQGLVHKDARAMLE